MRLKRYWLLALLPALLVVLSLIYMAGMAYLEGDPRDFWASLEWASETLTTTGYGHDSSWKHPAMNLFVVSTQFMGQFLIFLVFPIFVIPFFERRFEQRLPRSLPPLRDGFVVIYGYGPAVMNLIDNMLRDDIPFVVIEEREQIARRLRDRQIPVTYVELDQENLDLKGIERAQAMVANREDADNAVMIMAARQQGLTGPIYALVDDPKHRKPILLSGAKAAYSPLHSVAAALAAKASGAIAPRVAGLQSLAGAVELGEYRVHKESPLAGESLKSYQLGRHTGAKVVGCWAGGKLEAPPSATRPLAAGTLLVAVGSKTALDQLAQICKPLPAEGVLVVVGKNSIGDKVAQMLRDVGESVIHIGEVEGEGVDFVGDPVDPDFLETTGIEQARGIVLAIDSDATTLFATTVVRDMLPDVPIIAQVDRDENVVRTHAAGADWALSVSRVAGQLLAHQLFGERFLSVEPRIRVAKASPAGLVGQSAISGKVRGRTGATLVAIKRDDELVTQLGHEMILAEDDILYLCGSADAIDNYFEQFPEAKL